MHRKTARKPIKYFGYFCNVVPWFFANRTPIQPALLTRYPALAFDRQEALVAASIVVVTFRSDVNLPDQSLMGETAELIAQYLQRLVLFRAELQLKAQARYSDLA